MTRRDLGTALGGYALAAPLLLFLTLTFLVPLGMVAWRSVADPELGQALPETAGQLAAWDGRGLPPDAAFATIGRELKAAAPERLAALARRMSYETPTGREFLFGTLRKLKALAPEAPLDRAALEAADGRWTQPATWQVLKRAVGPADGFHLLSAVDLKWDYDRGLVDFRPEGGLYRTILLRTLAIGAATTLACMLLAFPLCAYLARVSERRRNLLLILVLLPFWTSILVRMTAWIVLLQDRGVVNDVLRFAGLIDAPLGLLFSRTGVILALVHVMLPFMIFPLLTAMRAADPRLMRAAASLGARPLHAFVRVYLPQILPGLMAGGMLVFIVTIGFYITPALLGGPGDQMIGSYIALFTTGTLNWGLASALGMILLGLTAVLFVAQTRLGRSAATGI
ncbi:ABC transporter permease [Labrys wisconsinensis]|uniref:Spermidine/putrescine transport system permease protein n=1 Tax=Labrys wisconsinensis TaxID=425677 RepID=A0ABU0J6B9_9HYPH|nr:ABC transporter permease [Labrys wisconsinensis]MDQ0469812.1 putative spermidine/putrescine transport system permease protein [Labrys wisconsinensis]